MVTNKVKHTYINIQNGIWTKGNSLLSSSPKYFETYPNHIPGLRKIWPIYSYTLLCTMLTYSYAVLWFYIVVHDLFATYTQNLHTNNTILFQFGSLSWISVQKYAHLNRDIKMGPFIYQSRKIGSVIYSFLGKRGLSYTWQRWIGGYSGRTSVPCHI